MIIVGFHPEHIAAHFARIERETIFAASLEYAEQRLRRVIEDIADAAAVSNTSMQFTLSGIEVDIRAIIKRINRERERAET